MSGAFIGMPPEIISTLVYSGAGPGPLLSVASAWQGLEAELSSAASGYQSIISDLVSQAWAGPGSTAMAAAATPYATWLAQMATVAGQTASQATLAANAFTTVHATVVPPQVVAANRAQLAQLVATNVLGQNFPAIAATEVQYYEYWIQDVAAMTNYLMSSTSASTLSTIPNAPQNTNPGGAAGQAAAVGNAQVNAAGSQVQNIVGSLLGQGTSSGAGSAGASGSTSLVPSWVTSLTGISSPKDLLSYGIMVPQNGSYIFSLTNSLQSLAKAMMGSAAPAAAAAAGVNAIAPALGGAGSLGGFGGIGTLASATLGQSGLVGGLSVPQTWASAMPSAASPLASLAAGASNGVTGIGASPTGLMNGMPMLAHAARAASGDGQFGPLPRFDLRPSVIPVSPAAG